MRMQPLLLLGASCPQSTWYQKVPLAHLWGTRCLPEAHSLPSKPLNLGVLSLQCSSQPLSAALAALLAALDDAGILSGGPSMSDAAASLAELSTPLDKAQAAPTTSVADCGGSFLGDSIHPQPLMILDPASPPISLVLGTHENLAKEALSHEATEQQALSLEANTEEPPSAHDGVQAVVLSLMGNPAFFFPHQQDNHAFQQEAINPSLLIGNDDRIIEDFLMSLAADACELQMGSQPNFADEGLHANIDGTTLHAINGFEAVKPLLQSATEELNALPLEASSKGTKATLTAEASTTILMNDATSPQASLQVQQTQNSGTHSGASIHGMPSPYDVPSPLGMPSTNAAPTPSDEAGAFLDALHRSTHEAIGASQIGVQPAPIFIIGRSNQAAAQANNAQVHSCAQNFVQFGSLLFPLHEDGAEVFVPLLAPWRSSKPSQHGLASATPKLSLSHDSLSLAHPMTYQAASQMLLMEAPALDDDGSLFSISEALKAEATTMPSTETLLEEVEMGVGIYQSSKQLLIAPQPGSTSQSSTEADEHRIISDFLGVLNEDATIGALFQEVHAPTEATCLSAYNAHTQTAGKAESPIVSRAVESEALSIEASGGNASQALATVVDESLPEEVHATSEFLSYEVHAVKAPQHSEFVAFPRAAPADSFKALLCEAMATHAGFIAVEAQMISTILEALDGAVMMTMVGHDELVMSNMLHANVISKEAIPVRALFLEAFINKFMQLDIYKTGATGCIGNSSSGNNIMGTFDNIPDQDFSSYKQPLGAGPSPTRNAVPCRSHITSNEDSEQHLIEQAAIPHHLIYDAELHIIVEPNLGGLYFSFPVMSNNSLPSWGEYWYTVLVREFCHARHSSHFSDFSDKWQSLEDVYGSRPNVKMKLILIILFGNYAPIDPG